MSNATRRAAPNGQPDMWHKLPHIRNVNGAGMASANQKEKTHG
jgi:hypothetical protein